MNRLRTQAPRFVAVEDVQDAHGASPKLSMRTSATTAMAVTLVLDHLSAIMLIGLRMLRQPAVC